MFFCSQLFGFFPLGLCRRQPRNRQIHRQVCWKRHLISGVVGKRRNIGFVGFLGNVEPKWRRKYRKWLCCEIFVTKSKLKASLAVWRNLLPYIFQGGLQPVWMSRPCCLQRLVSVVKFIAERRLAFRDDENVGSPRTSFQKIFKIFFKQVFEKRGCNASNDWFCNSSTNR